jgi:hypothetical protein
LQKENHGRLGDDEGNRQPKVAIDAGKRLGAYGFEKEQAQPRLQIYEMIGNEREEVDFTGKRIRHQSRLSHFYPIILLRIPPAFGSICPQRTGSGIEVEISIVQKWNSKMPDAQRDAGALLDISRSKLLYREKASLA